MSLKMKSGAEAFGLDEAKQKVERGDCAETPFNIE